MSLRTNDSYKPNEEELRNLRERGTLCPIRNAFKTKNCIVIGKIIKMFPIVRKSKYQRSTILIIKLEDICKASRRIFKTMFSDEAAELLDNIYLEVNDYLLFFNKKLYKIPFYPDDSLPDNEYKKQFVIGLWPESSVQDVFYRRKTGCSWLPLNNTNGRACEASSSRVDDLLADILEDDNNSSILLQDSAVLQNEAVKSKLNDLNLKSPNKRIETIQMNENKTNRSVTCNVVTINASNEDSNESEIILRQTEASVEKNCDKTICGNSNNDVSIENNEAQDHSSSPEIFIDVSKKRSNVNNLLDGVANCEEISNSSQTFEEDGSNYLIEWPENFNDVFYIRVRLLTTNPIIDAYSSEADFLSILKSYCEKCFQMFTYNEWNYVSDNGICPNCNEEVRFLIMLELLLEDRYGNTAWAVVLGKYAEIFFGCKIDEIFTSAEVRSRIKKMIDSYSTAHFRKKTPTLLVRIIPFDSDGFRFKYRITNVIFCDQ